MTHYYEDFEIGQSFSSPGRTITETDCVMFTMLSGDWNPLHSNAEFAANSHFGQRVINGAFGLALVFGMTSRLGLFEGSGRGLLGLDEWRFKSPMFIGDTVHVEMKVLGKRLSSRAGVGVLERQFTIRKHEGTIVQQGRSAMLIAVRDPDHGTR